MATQRPLLTSDDLADLPTPVADARIAYGDAPQQFGDLRVPDGPGPHPVAILLHGGCWLAEYDLTYFASLADTLARAGIATWSLEYRRVGDEGGGWPGTFHDVARGADHLRAIAEDRDLDLGRVIAAGHSAGGHLALWLAGRHRLPERSELYAASPLPLRGVLALAPAAHLAPLQAEGTCEHAVSRLMGGSPAEFPERYRDGSPAEMVPLGLPQVIVVGRHDETWRPNGEAYHAIARDAGDPAELRIAEDSGHFEMVVPTSSTWPMVEAAARALVGR